MTEEYKYKSLRLSQLSLVECKTSSFLDSPRPTKKRSVVEENFAGGCGSGPGVGADEAPDSDGTDLIS